jgi:hypothetical protein
MKKKNIKGSTKRLALSALLCTLGVVILAVGSVLSALDLTMVAISSLLIVFAVMELGTPYQYLIYAVTSLLSMLLLPDKYAAFLYVIFGGIYPIIKSLIEKFGRVIPWVIKAVYFNLVITAMVLGSKYLFGIDDETFSVGLYILGNLAFFMCDIAMTRLIALYLMRFRKKLRIEKYFEK